MKWNRQREIVQMLKPSNRRLNVLNVRGNNTYWHELMRFEICYYLKKNKIDFYTEVEFKNGKGIADIVVLDQDGYCVEVVASESRRSIKAKEEKYPLPIRVVKARQAFHPKVIQ